MLFFSEGIDYDINDVIRGYDAAELGASTIMDDIRDTIAATARSNVSIYAIDPRGLTALGDDAIGVGSFADSDSEARHRRAVGAGNRPVVADERSAAVPGQPACAVGRERRLCRGEPNDFTTAFERIVRDNSSYYVLAYYPPTDKRDGKFHQIEVKVNRPGLTVRSRRGYVSPRGKPRRRPRRPAG